MAPQNGTVLHEIQMLERQLDRLLPSLESFNSRISKLETEAINIKEKIRDLRGHDEDFYACRDKSGKKLVEITKDIEQLQKDSMELSSAIDSINDDEKNSRKIWSQRLWKAFMIIWAAAISIIVAYYTVAFKRGDYGLHNEVKSDVNKTRSLDRGRRPTTEKNH